MAGVTGLITTSDLTTGVKINMDEAIYLISPLDSPLINGLDVDGAVILGSTPVDEIQFYWMDEELLVPRAALSGAVTTGDLFITLASNDERLRFSTGDILLIEKAGATERLRVTGYGTTTGSLTVTRAYSGTATNYASGAYAVGLGTALAEGSDPEAARALDRVQDFNYTQIFGPTKVHMSGTEQVVAKYGVANEFTKQTFNRSKENVVAREQAYLYGPRTNSTTTKIRTTGGIVSFITSNVDATSTQLNVTTVEALMQSAYDRGGVPDILAANPHSLADLNALNDSGRVRVDIADARRGRQRVMAVHTEYGDVTVVRNRYLQKSDALLWSREQVIRRPLRPMMMERLAKTGDSDSLQLLCEEGLEVKGEEHLGRFSALSYT